MFVLPWKVTPKDRDEDRYNYYCTRDCKWAFLSVIIKRQASTAEALIGVLGFYRRNDYLARACLEKARKGIRSGIKFRKITDNYP